MLEKAKPEFKPKVQATFEFAITEAINKASPAPKQILTDAGVKPSHLRPQLFKKVESLEGAAIPTPSIYATALGHIGGQEAIDLLCELLNNLQEQQLAGERQESVGDSAAQEAQLKKLVILERIMLDAVGALRISESEGAVDCLAGTLVTNINFRVKRQAIDALGKLGSTRCILPLLEALIAEKNEDLQAKISEALKGIDDWQEKGNQLVAHLTKSGVRRDQLNSKLVLTAIQPRKELLAQNPHLLTDFLIGAAVKQFKDKRLLRIYTELIKVNANNNDSVINEQLERFGKEKKISEEILQAVRVEIGGEETLRPLLNKLEENLLEYFQKPIDKLNTETQSVWKRTIFLANLGFVTRLIINVAIFVIGVYFMIDSYRQIVAGNLTTEQVAALMAVFIGGGATMFYSFIKFPLSQMRQAVTDVGLANVAFISYIHRVLQISHTFSYFYLNGDINFEEIKSAASQIESNSHGAILTLKIASSDGEQVQFDKALLDRIEIVSSGRKPAVSPNGDEAQPENQPANTP